MEWVNVEKFKREAGLCLQKFGLQALRSYARKVGLPIATKLNKEEMILQTIAVICGERTPAFTKRGAPRKNEFVPPELMAEMDELVKVYLRGEEPSRLAEQEERKTEREEEKPPYYTIIVQNEKGERVACFGTNLDFQIVISNQRTITSADVRDGTSEKAENKQ